MFEELKAYRTIIIAVGIIALLFGIYLKGHSDGAHATQIKWDADKTAIANEAAKQAAITTAKVIAAENTTEIVTNDYEQQIARIKTYYAGPGRHVVIGLCNNAAANSGAMPTVSSTAKGVDEGTSNQDATRSNNELDTLAASCAETTQQVIGLQNWITQQRKINP